MRKWKDSIRKVSVVLLALSMALTPCLTGFGTTAMAAEPEPEDKDTYQVTLKKSEHGKLKFKDTDKTKKSFKVNDFVEVEAEPEKGYLLEKFTLQVDGSEEKLEDTSGGDTFTFNMPAADITLEASFVKADSQELKAAKRMQAAMARAVGSVTYYKKVSSGGTTCGKFKVNGKNAFCIDHYAGTPGVGTPITSISESNNKALRKVLYYGYGGPERKVSNTTSGWVQTTIAASCANGIFAGTEATRALWNKVQTLPDAPDSFKVFIAHTSGSGLQDLAYWEHAPMGELSLLKKSADTSITKGNECYSLAGAKYGVYSDSKCTDRLGVLTTKASGKSNEIEVDEGTYYIKEIKAPKGYLKDDRVHSVKVKADQTTVFEVEDEPGNDPAAIEIEKISQDAAAGAKETASLAGAQFTVKYYDGYYTKDTLPKKATRTWVIETKEQKLSSGKITYGCSLYPSYKVSGSEFYYGDDDKTPVLPLGTISIEETKAPKGYVLDGAYLTPEGSNKKVKGVYVSQIRMGEDEVVKLKGGNKFKVSDRSVRGGVKVQKRDFHTNAATPQGGATLKNTKFEIVSLNDYPVVVEGKVYQKNAVVKTIVSNEKGLAQTSNNLLPFGKYRVREAVPPTGYLPEGTLSRDFTISVDGKLEDLTGTENSISNKIIHGGVKIRKGDYESKDFVPQGGATFKGAQFDIVTLNDNPVVVEGKTYQKGQTVKTIVTDDKGMAQTAADLLPYGKYRIQESKPPVGYLPEGTLSRDFTITVNGKLEDLTDAAHAILNEVVRGGIKIQKRDFESQDAVPQGSATLKGAEFEITSLNENFVIVEGKTYKKGDVVKTIVTDEKGLAQTAADLLPYGRYKITEVKAPAGYLPEGVLTREFEITENGKLKDLTGENTSILNRVKRGDFEFTKADEENQERMADIPFKLTSNTTKESHQFVTDENGYYSTASAFNKHTHDTNGGKKDSGLWFGLDAEGKNVPPNDKYGALPYDTYTLEELPCDANADKVLYKGTITITRDNFLIDMGTIDNPDLTLQTKAIDEETGTHFSHADEEVTILDTVSYTGLKKGKEYVLTGTLADKATGEALLDKEGKPITATKTFKPVTAEGEVEVEFTFDASKFQGKTLVVFEELTLDGQFVAEHKDINDADQTIYFPEIGTQAKDSESGNHISSADKEVTIVDTVSYTNLQKGKKYTVKGVLMDKDTQKPVLDAEGQKITAETSFVAESASGSVDVVFKFDGSNLGGETIVVFEEVYRGDKLYAVHADIEDEAQTITFPGIKTTATDADTNSKIILADEEVHIKDVVEYWNLVPGQEYTLKGTLMDRETGEPVVAKNALLSDGKDSTMSKEELPVTAETSFIAEKAEGTVEVDFIFDGSKYSGATFVVFEELFLNGKPIGEHKDLEDEGQTVYAPGIHTTATDKADGDKEILADGKVTIRDKVSYENLVPGEKYKVEGTLMDKESGNAVLIDGKEVKATAEFTAQEESGSVLVDFTFDATKLGGKDVVVFEKLYNAEAREVANHEDINDENQTVELVEKPPVPEKPEKPENPPKPPEIVQTGDTVKMYVLAGCAVILLGTGSVLLFKKRKNLNK